MVDALKPSMFRTWSIVSSELSPLWLGIYAGTANINVDEKAISDAAWKLRQWAIDLIDWPNSNKEIYHTIPVLCSRQRR